MISLLPYIGLLLIVFALGMLYATTLLKPDDTAHNTPTRRKKAKKTRRQ